MNFTTSKEPMAAGAKNLEQGPILGNLQGRPRYVNDEDLDVTTENDLDATVAEAEVYQSSKDSDFDSWS